MTETADRRTVPELQARYALEPSLRDVYVEGPSDRTLVEMAFGLIGDKDLVRAYEVDTVHVPASLLERRSLSAGNKSRVLALADELAVTSTRDLSGSAACLADLDLDGILNRCRDYRLLVYTQGLSLDRVLTLPQIAEKLLSVVLLGFPVRAQALLDQMLPVLNMLLLYRLAAETLAITAAPPALAKVCSFDGHTLQFKSDVFVGRYLQKAGASPQATRFHQIVQTHRGEIAREPRKYVHVEDFVKLLHFCVHRVKPKHVPKYAHFRRFLFGLLDAYMVADLPEIQEIAARFGVGRQPNSRMQLPQPRCAAVAPGTRRIAERRVESR